MSNQPLSNNAQNLLAPLVAKYVAARLPAGSSQDFQGILKGVQKRLGNEASGSILEAYHAHKGAHAAFKGSLG